ncbi:hypothetical protein [Pseudomonas sp. PSPC3-3]
MRPHEKYKELVDLLESVGALQLDEEWALLVQQMIKDHRKGISHDHQPND